MRIFYASDTTPNAAFQSNLWRNNLYLPLVDLGHEVIEFQYDLRETFQNLDPTDSIQKEFIAKNRPKVSEELLSQIKAAHAIKPVDLFFSYFYDACVLPEAIEEIRAMGIKTVNWYCNGSYQLHLVAEISPHYDWCLVPEKFRLKDYVAMGARPIYCQEAANPNIYKPYDLPVEFDVTFVGQAYGDRPGYIKYLLERGIDIRVWGYGWQYYNPDIRETSWQTQLHRALGIGRKLLTPEGWQKVGKRLQTAFQAKPDGCASSSTVLSKVVDLPSAILGGTLSDLEMIQMYSRSKINLGFSTCGNTHETGQRILQVRLRDFEVPMTGGFYMVEYMEELEEFFNIGKEIVCYTGPEDLAEKIKYYLSHDTEREAIRKAGYERCQRDHPWHKRFEMVFREMGLS
ncbi:MAG: CgeB family protein [Thermincolia bacterium]